MSELNDDEMKKAIDKALQPGNQLYGTWTNAKTSEYTYENLKKTMDLMKETQVKFNAEFTKLANQMANKMMESFNMAFHELYGIYGKSRYEMTEQEWLTSTDPRAMYEFIKGRITERQMRFFVEACRTKASVNGDHGSWEANIWSVRFSDWCYEMYPGDEIGWAGRAYLLREIVPFLPIVFGHKGYSAFGKSNTSIILDPVILEWRDGTIPRMARKIAGVCPECDGKGSAYSLNEWAIPKGWHEWQKCLHCKTTGYIHEPHWDDLPYLADACEEAEVEASIVAHLRRSGGHVRGCWALELFLGGTNAQARD